MQNHFKPRARARARASRVPTTYYFTTPSHSTALGSRERERESANGCIFPHDPRPDMGFDPAPWYLCQKAISDDDISFPPPSPPWLLKVHSSHWQSRWWPSKWEWLGMAWMFRGVQEFEVNLLPGNHVLIWEVTQSIQWVIYGSSVIRFMSAQPGWPHYTKGQINKHAVWVPYVLVTH